MKIPYLVIPLILVVIAFIARGALFSLRVRRAKQGPALRVTRSGKKICSLVMLLREGRVLNVPELQAAASRVFRTEFGADRQRDASYVEQVNPDVFLVVVRGHTLGVISSAKPYPKTLTAALKLVKIPRLRHMMQDHQGWIALDAVGAVPNDFKPRAYDFMGQLLADLAEMDGMQPLGIYAPETGKIAPFTRESLRRLRGGDPLSAAVPENVTNDASSNNPAMRAAVEEARRRWPEFVKAFENRTPAEHFSAKGRFEHQGHVEYLWLTVTAIENNVTFGMMDNTPTKITGMHTGSKVKIEFANLYDWLIAEDHKIVAGGFTIQVLEDAANSEDQG